jgi:hypothetical protein
MSRRSTSSIGALHPVLFFIFIYGISLMLALFVCRTVYYSIHGDGTEVTGTAQQDQPFSASSMNVTALK